MFPFHYRLLDVFCVFIGDPLIIDNQHSPTALVRLFVHHLSTDSFVLCVFVHFNVESCLIC